MCDSLDSASAELAIDLAIERQRRQIEREVARAHVGRAASRIPQIHMQRLVNVREALASVDTTDRLHGEDQRGQIVAADVSVGEAF